MEGEVEEEQEEQWMVGESVTSVSCVRESTMFGSRRFQSFLRYAAGRTYSQSVTFARESQMKYYLSPLLGLVLGGVAMVVPSGIHLFYSL
jgi:hypothetical protein